MRVDRGLHLDREAMPGFGAQLMCTIIAGHLARAEQSAPQAGRLLAGPRDVFGVAATVALDAVRRQFQHTVRQSGKEMPVVGHEQHRALEA